MRDKEGFGFFGVKGLRDGTKKNTFVLVGHNCGGCRAVEVSIFIFDEISEIKEKW